MSNLRSLLPTYSDYTTPDLTNRTTTINRLKPGQELVFVGMCGTVQDTNYNRNMLCCWVVPAGVTRITFELWGAGGSGAGSCCCSWGVPGGAGAYARKTIYATTPGGFAGCAYCLCAAYPGCCAPTMGCGYRGCSSFIVGPGLTNFCAEGGIPGCSYCWPNIAYQCNPSFNNKCNIGWLQMGQCNVLAQWCACYYGADIGQPGCNSFLYTDQCSGNSCQYKPVVAIPGHLPSPNAATAQSYHILRYCDANQPGSWDGCRIGYGYMGGANGRTPGAGGNTAAACAGSCYCGSPGGPGMIRIQYSYDTVIMRTS